MDRQMRAAVVAAVIVMIVLVLAASSGPFDVWSTPPAGDDVATVVTDPPEEIEPQEPVPESRTEWPNWVSTLSRVIGVIVALAVFVVALAVLRVLRMPTWIRPSPLRRRSNTATALPEVDDGGVTVDVESARAALSGGTARNAIVACWMRLERDAADAGMPRLPSDTPTEYVERVIGASSVDPVPIGELAALYREARFSSHELTDEHRARAMVALDRVADALQLDAEAPA